jgi:hypothetical protein
MKKTAFSILAVLLTASSLFASFFKPFEPVYVSKTEHFDFIYSDETKASAELLASRADEIYDALKLYSGYKGDRRFPVVVTGREESMNAYFTPYPSSRIIMYDSLDLPLSISYYENEFISIFTHELAHAMSLTNLEGIYKAVATVLGDPLNLHYLNGRSFDFEGFAVMSESAGGQGRLNDPFALSPIVTAKAEGELPSLFDAEADSLYCYRYGAPFAAYSANKFGNEAYNRFFLSAGKLNPIPYFSTFGRTKASVFNEFLDTVSVPQFAPDETIAPDVSRLYSTKDGILGLSYGTFLLVGDDGLKKQSFVANAVDRNGSVTRVLDIDSWSRYRYFDEKKAVKTAENTLMVLPHENGEYSLIVNEGQVAVLKRGDECIFSTSDSVVDAELFGDEVVIAGYDGEHIVLSFTSSGKEYVFPDDILINQLSITGDKVAFAWGRRSEPYGLTRFGWFEDGVIHLDSANHLGCVTYPVIRDENSFYFIADCTKRYYLKKAEIGKTEDIVLQSRDIVGNVISVPAFSSSKGYNPFSYLWRGLLQPVAVDDYRPFLGASFVTSDPAEKISLFLSGTFDTGLLKAGLNSVVESYSNRIAAEYSISNSELKFSHAISKKISLFPSSFVLTLSSAEDWTAYTTAEEEKNRFSFRPSLSLDQSKKTGPGYFDTLSYGIGLDYSGAFTKNGYEQDWGGSAYLRFPLLFFLEKDPVVTYNLPIKFSAAIGYSSNMAATASVYLMLSGIRLDKGLPYTGLTLNRAYLLLGAGALVPRNGKPSMNLVDDVISGIPDTQHYVSLSAAAALSSPVPKFSGFEMELYFEIGYCIETNSFLYTVDVRNPF